MLDAIMSKFPKINPFLLTKTLVFSAQLMIYRFLVSCHPRISL